MINDIDIHTCAFCAYFYDEDGYGIGKCEKAHGGITSGDSNCLCYLYYADDPRIDDQDEDELF